MNLKEIREVIIETILCNSTKHTCPTSYMIRNTMSCTGGMNTENACENVAENGICIYCNRVVNRVR